MAGDEAGFDEETVRRIIDTPPSLSSSSSSRPHKIRKTAQTHEARERSSISALLSQHQTQSPSQIQTQIQTQSRSQPQTQWQQTQQSQQRTHGAAGDSNEHLREGLASSRKGGEANTDTETALHGGREDSIPSSENVLRVLLEEPLTTTTKTTTPPTMDQKISCELCKTRKVKCDRAEPACSWCARHNRQCVYLKRQTPGSRTRINAELEAKVNRIDSLLRALGRRVEEHISHDHAGGFVGAGPGSVTTTNNNPGSNNGDGVSPSLGSPTAAGSSIFRPDDDHNQTPVSLPPPMTSSSSGGMLWQSSSAGHGAPESSVNDYDDDETVAGGIGGSTQRGLGLQRYSPSSSTAMFRAPNKTSGAELPPHDMLYTLVDLFFKHCNTWCPILDRKTIFGTFFGATSLEEPDRVLLHAIVATTLRFSKDARLTPEAREYYHATSSQVVRLYAMDHITVPALRALVIISLDAFGTASGPRAWNMLAMVAQSVKQLGLCDEVSVYLSTGATGTAPLPTSSQDMTSSQDAQSQMPLQPPQPTQQPGAIHQSKPDSWIEDEGRRRLCWVVYLLDRYATVCAATTTASGGASSFLLEDHAMRRFLPCSYDLFSKNVPVETRSSTDGLDDGLVDVGITNNSNSNNNNNNISTPSSSVPPSASLESASSMANRAENLGSFSYHCKLLRILSRIHDFLREPVDIAASADMARWRNTYQALDATLDGWLRGLPSEFSKISALCHSDPASRVSNWFMLHSAYVTAVVRLHAPVAYPTARSTLFLPSQYAVQRCLSAVHSLADIARDLREANGLDLLGPPFAFSLWVAARVLLVHASTVDATNSSSVHGVLVDGRIDFFIETLRHVGRHWAVANNYAATLARVVQRGRQGEITFANMRRSAYDLLALTATTRQSGAEPMSTQVTSLCELDNIDVFAFFVYPRIEDEMAKLAQQQYSAPQHQMHQQPHHYSSYQHPQQQQQQQQQQQVPSINNNHMNSALRTPMGSMGMLPGSPHRGSSVF
ncbi:hypothetical protein SBRCBS47491_005697 [Sporothrix bragantina]|uniref:Zn(2)-C6 fungal-type domain-containing protein n=1 Tax=Sporothrix bragantina TaxID=671064 RepID=A0ABP0BYN7_9PEZI